MFIIYGLQTWAYCLLFVKTNNNKKYKDWNKDKNHKSWQETENSHIYIPGYTYQTAKTRMKSYIFYKGFIPSENQIQNLFTEFTAWCDSFEKNFCWREIT